MSLLAQQGLKARRTADVLIVGGGIIGAACAREFARQGLSVAVIEPGPVGGGATAAAMGHLLVSDALDEADALSQAEYALSRRSLDLWRQWLGESADNSHAAEYQRCGSLWLAADAQELELAARKQAWYRAQGLAAELLSAAELAAAEPMLRPGLAGALRVPGDARVYPPRVAARWLQQARVQRVRGEVSRLGGQGGTTVVLSDGRQLWGALTVLCAGLACQRWLPPGWLLAKKGQLAITQSYPEQVRHQLIELGYLQRAHQADRDSVSFNVQPRPGGQLLIGSSRQTGREDRALDMDLLQQMLRQACHYLPGLRDMHLLRCWTGLRPASRDGVPLIGRHPELERVWLATGHEGLGISTAPATAELLAQLSLGQACTLNPAPFEPRRLQ